MKNFYKRQTFWVAISLHFFILIFLFSSLQKTDEPRAIIPIRLPTFSMNKMPVYQNPPPNPQQKNREEPRQLHPMHPKAVVHGPQTPLSAHWVTWIRQQIVSQITPPDDWEGEKEATLAFKLLPSGAIEDLKLIHSTGSPQFDRLTLQALQSVGRFPALNGELSQEISLKITIRFEK